MGDHQAFRVVFGRRVRSGRLVRHREVSRFNSAGLAAKSSNAQDLAFERARQIVNRHSTEVRVRHFRLKRIAVGLVLVTACDKAANESAPVASGASAPAATATPVRRGSPPVDLCSLVTEAEAEAILGKSLAPPQKQRGGDCWYLREGGSDFGDVEFILSFIAAYPRSEKEFDEFVAEQVSQINANMKKSGVGMVQFTAEPARDVGAPAYFIDPGLYVLKGNRILGVGLGGEKGVAIAKAALPRIPN